LGEAIQDVENFLGARAVGNGLSGQIKQSALPAGKCLDALVTLLLNEGLNQTALGAFEPAGFEKFDKFRVEQGEVGRFHGICGRMIFLGAKN